MQEEAAHAALDAVQAQHAAKKSSDGPPTHTLIGLGRAGALYRRVSISYQIH